MSTVSRMVKDDLEPLARALTRLGLKVVPVDFRCVEPDEYATLVKWAIRRLEEESGEPVDTALQWDTPK